MSTLRIKKVTQEWIHGELPIHGFFHFGGGEFNYLSEEFSGFTGCVDTPDQLIRAILPDFGDIRDTRVMMRFPLTPVPRFTLPGELLPFSSTDIFH